MRIDAWLAAVVADAERRGLPELHALLESVDWALYRAKNAGGGTASG